MTKITIVSASGVKNLELAHRFEEQLKKLGAETHVLNVMKLDLPLYHSDSDAKHNGKELLGPWFDIINQSSGFVFLAPEYNGGLPPVFTNFLAWVSRSSKEWRTAFNGKAAAIGSYSAGSSGNVLVAMRMQLAYIGMNVLGRQIQTHSQKALDEASLLDVCQQLLKHSK